MVHLLEEIENYAKKNNIPIMQKDGIEYLLTYIGKENIKTILEIGTAIGYSAIKMASTSKDIKVVTIEKDKKRYKEAIKNIEKCGLQDRITVHLADALEINIKDTFDFIFIDAAKSKYIHFFEKYKYNLHKNGIILSDNLNFHGLVHTKEEIKSRNVRGIVRKLKNYIEFLQNNKEFKTTFTQIGDGIGISKKIV